MDARHSIPSTRTALHAYSDVSEAILLDPFSVPGPELSLDEPQARISVDVAKTSAMPGIDTPTPSDDIKPADIPMGAVARHSLGRRSRARKNRQAELLLVALLESFCDLYARSNGRGKALFFVLCRELSRMGIIGTNECLEELSSARADYIVAFRELLAQAISAVHNLDGANDRLLSNAGLNTLCPGDETPSHDPSPIVTAASTLELLSAKSLGFLDDHMDFSKFLQPQTTRYHQDFVELALLGRGAFGSVHRCRNKIDGLEYAIKQIQLTAHETEDLEKVFREVKLLARTTSVFVVRYYSSWLEHVQVTSTRYTSRTPCHSEIESSDEHRPKSMAGVNETDGIAWPSSSKIGGSRGASYTSSAWQPGSTDSRSTSPLCLTGSAQTTSSSTSDSDECRRVVKSATETPPAYELTLYIQMELCEHTLQDWLDDRNARYARDPTIYFLSEALECFINILRSLDYIHSLNLIHRDVKPENIYWKSSTDSARLGRWKLGDFGLATTLHLPLFEHGKEGEMDGEMGARDTFAAGTRTYASPEQLDPTRSSDVGRMSDIYSLGIVLLELLYPCNTGMERAKSLSNLRNGILPESFLQSYPKEAALILWMTVNDPGGRPTARQLLELELDRVLEAMGPVESVDAAVANTVASIDAMESGQVRSDGKSSVGGDGTGDREMQLEARIAALELDLAETVAENQRLKQHIAMLESRSPTA